MYATRLPSHRGGTYLSGFAHREKVAELFYRKPVERFAVRDLSEGETSIYWAWWDAKERRFHFVFPHRSGVEICFPYGTKCKVDAGEGEVVNVFIEPLPSPL